MPQIIAARHVFFLISVYTKYQDRYSYVADSYLPIRVLFEYSGETLYGLPSVFHCAELNRVCFSKSYLLLSWCFAIFLKVW